jgi:hypothetical protein
MPSGGSSLEWMNHPRTFERIEYCAALVRELLDISHNHGPLYEPRYRAEAAFALEDVERSGFAGEELRAAEAVIARRASGLRPA